MIKKLMALAFCFLLVFATNVSASNTHVKTPAEITAEDILLTKIATEIGPGNYKGLQDWLSKNIKYQNDRRSDDEWREPFQVLKDGYGACTAFSVVSLEILKRMGEKNVFLLGVTSVGRNMGHVVTIFKTNPEDVWRYYNFEKLEKGKVGFKDTIYAIARESRYGSHIEYQLADVNRKNVPQANEKDYPVLGV